jgi:hypothetical protein
MTQKDGRIEYIARKADQGVFGETSKRRCSSIWARLTEGVLFQRLPRQPKNHLSSRRIHVEGPS